MKALRHFYRCNDCLTVAVTADYIEPTRDQRGYPQYAECGSCGGKVEYLGPVNQQRIQHMEWHCACDGRCTSASGPSCDCQCGGENHGTGAMVQVLVRTEGLPRLMTPPDAAGKADTYRALVAAFRAAWDARYADVTADKRSGYIRPSAFQSYLDGQHCLDAFGKARGLRTHGGRNKKIIALTESLGSFGSGV